MSKYIEADHLLRWRVGQRLPQGLELASGESSSMKGLRCTSGLDAVVEQGTHDDGTQTTGNYEL